MFQGYRDRGPRVRGRGGVPVVRHVRRRRRQVVRGGRQGFAYAGSLDEEVLAETLAEARDNARSRAPRLGSVCRAGRRPPVVLTVARGAGGLPTADKVNAPSTSSGRTRRRPRVRQVESANWGDACSEKLWPARWGYRPATVRRRATCRPSPWREGPEPGGLRLQRRPCSSELDSAKAAGDAVTRPCVAGSDKPRSAHLPVVFEPRVSAVDKPAGSVLSGRGS